MRFILSVCAVALAFGSLGCSTTYVDPTLNQGNNNNNVKYPAGPYGYVQDETIENIQFIGKVDPGGINGGADYTTLKMNYVSLADYHNDPAVKYIWMAGTAGWCAPCNAEQKFVGPIQTEFEPRGVRIVEAMVQGFDARSGAPATEDDINRWAAKHDLHVMIALDPQFRIQQYADVSAFPLNMILRTSDMKIVFMSTGGQDMTPVLEDLLAN